MPTRTNLNFLRFSFYDADRLIYRFNRRGFRARCIRIGKGRFIVTVIQ